MRTQLNLLNSTAVSYTHLDVYKRQDIARALLYTGLIPQTFRTFIIYYASSYYMGSYTSVNVRLTNFLGFLINSA